jgi:hypothetical protein
MRSAAFFLLLGLALLPVPGAKAQEEPLSHKKNNLSIAPLVCIDRTIPLSYSRYLSNNWNYTLYSRIRFGRNDGTVIEQGWFGHLDKFHQPYIYSRVFLRSGAQYHKRRYMLEPLLQLDRGWLQERELIIYDSGEGSDQDITEIQDRDYYSAGIILLAGSYHDFPGWRIRTFVGFGTHLKYFQVDAKDSWNAEPDWLPYYEEYFRFMLSVHLGVEIGINF